MTYTTNEMMTVAAARRLKKTVRCVSSASACRRKPPTWRV